MLNWLKGTGVGTRAALGAGGGAAVGTAAWAMGDENASFGKRVLGGAAIGAGLATAGHYGYKNRDYLKGLGGEGVDAVKSATNSAITKTKEVAGPAAGKAKDAMSSAVDKVVETAGNVRDGVSKAHSKMKSNQAKNKVYEMKPGGDNVMSRGRTGRGSNDEWGLGKILQKGRSNQRISL